MAAGLAAGQPRDQARQPPLSRSASVEARKFEKGRRPESGDFMQSRDFMLQALDEKDDGGETRTTRRS
jgi:hypothetical protein